MEITYKELIENIRKNINNYKDCGKVLVKIRKLKDDELLDLYPKDGKKILLPNTYKERMDLLTEIFYVLENRLKE